MAICVWWHHRCFGFRLHGVGCIRKERCVGINERMRRLGVQALANLDFIVRLVDVWMGAFVARDRWGRAYHSLTDRENGSKTL